MMDVIKLAKTKHKKTIRLDILEGNIAAEKLYRSCGFILVETKTMYYPDTGNQLFSMYEYIL